VEGLRFRGQSFAVTVDADGRASVEGLAGGFEVRDGSA
jgi:hypothetical protein